MRARKKKMTFRFSVLVREWNHLNLENPKSRLQFSLAPPFFVVFVRLFLISLPFRVLLRTPASQMLRKTRILLRGVVWYHWLPWIRNKSFFRIWIFWRVDDVFFRVLIIFVVFHIWKHFWKIFRSKCGGVNCNWKTSVGVTWFRIFEGRMINFDGENQNLLVKSFLKLFLCSP